MVDSTIYVGPDIEPNIHINGKTLFVLDRARRDPLIKSFINANKTSGRISYVEEVTVDQMKGFKKPGEDAAQQNVELGENANQKYVLNTIDDAIKAGASDIHLFVNKVKDTFDVKYRVLGDRDIASRDVPKPAAYGMDIMRCIYQSMCDIAGSQFHEHREQNASMKRDILPPEISGVRIAHSHVMNGHKMVGRLLYKNAAGKTLQSLGILPSQIATLLSLMARPDGITLFTGVTGSGKSTSLTALLMLMFEMSNRRDNIITVEDPVEFILDGIYQIPVQDNGDPQERRKAYHSATEIIMRMDPDACMISELRDLTSIETAIDISLSGHKVLTSFHVIGIINLLFRMAHKGLRKETIADHNLVTGMVSQSLVKTLCPHCSIPVSEIQGKKADHLKRRLELGQIDFRTARIRGDGCQHCRGGYVGRTALAEVAQNTEEFVNYYLKEEKGHMRSLLREMGVITKTEVALIKISEGLVDIRDAEKELGPFDNNSDNLTFSNTFTDKLHATKEKERELENATA